MTKPVIAVDIDDVLAANAEGFVAYSNEHWGMSLKPEDYHEHWAELWQVDHEETRRRATQLHASGVFGRHRHYDEAKPVLEALKEHYELIIVTARISSIREETQEWLDTHFKGIFSDIRLAGIFDTKFTKDTWTNTKADLFTEIGAQFVIDDQLKHCLAASQLGIDTILFGDYSWNQMDELPDGVTRCSDWASVAEYFDARRS